MDGASWTQGCHQDSFSNSWLCFILLFKKYTLKFIYLVVSGLRCGMQTLSYCMWDLVPGPGIKPRPSVLGA